MVARWVGRPRAALPPKTVTSFAPRQRHRRSRFRACRRQNAGLPRESSRRSPIRRRERRRASCRRRRRGDGDRGRTGCTTLPPENRCSADAIVSIRSSIDRTALTSVSVRRRKRINTGLLSLNLVIGQSGNWIWRFHDRVIDCLSNLQSIFRSPIKLPDYQIIESAFRLPDCQIIHFIDAHGVGDCVGVDRHDGVDVGGVAAAHRDRDGQRAGGTRRRPFVAGRRPSIVIFSRPSRSPSYGSAPAR